MEVFSEPLRNTGNSHIMVYRTYPFGFECWSVVFSTASYDIPDHVPFIQNRASRARSGPAVGTPVKARFG